MNKQKITKQTTVLYTILITFLISYFVLFSFALSSATWHNCDDNNLGVIKEGGETKYICSVKDGDYMWITYEEKSKESCFINSVIYFFKKILFYL